MTVSLSDQRKIFWPLVLQLVEYEKRVKGTPGYSEHHFAEAQQRLKQMNFARDRIVTCTLMTPAMALLGEARWRQMTHGARPEIVAKMRSLGMYEKTIAATPVLENYEEMETLTVAFYYIAGRLRSVLQKSIVGMKKFEAAGVRNVRNQLLEHPEGTDSTITETGDSWNTHTGPVIKSTRAVGKEHIFPDRGLYLNAEEFRANLEALLVRLLA